MPKKCPRLKRKCCSTLSQLCWHCAPSLLRARRWCGARGGTWPSARSSACSSACPAATTCTSPLAFASSWASARTRRARDRSGSILSNSRARAKRRHGARRIQENQGRPRLFFVGEARLDGVFLPRARAPVLDDDRTTCSRRPEAVDQAMQAKDKVRARARRATTHARALLS